MKAILKKLHDVSCDVEYIRKDAKNAHQKYTYASEKVIKQAFGEAFRKHGIVFSLSEGIPAVIGSILIVPMTYRFWDIDSGESLSGDFNGSGHTRDDKGHYAAITGAIKYILTSNFLIATGDDPEKQKAPPPKKEEPVTAERCKAGIAHLLGKDVPQEVTDEAVQRFIVSPTINEAEPIELDRLFDWIKQKIAELKKAE